MLPSPYIQPHKRRTDHAAQIEPIRAESIMARAQRNIDHMHHLAQSMHDRIAQIQLVTMDTAETVN